MVGRNIGCVHQNSEQKASNMSVGSEQDMAQQQAAGQQATPGRVAMHSLLSWCARSVLLLPKLLMCLLKLAS